MQLGMIGLGRMGANIVRRIMRDGDILRCGGPRDGLARRIEALTTQAAAELIAKWGVKRVATISPDYAYGQVSRIPAELAEKAVRVRVDSIDCSTSRPTVRRRARARASSRI